MPSSGGSSSSSFSIPCSPAAIIAASARYGFTSAPGSRFSIRSDGPCPTARSEQVRLSSPQAIAVGANEPVREALVRVHVRRVEQRQLAHARDLAGDELVEQRLVLAEHVLAGLSASEQWMWHELPSASLNLARKVIAMSSCAAISLAPFL